MTDQPMPTPGRVNVTPVARSLFLELLAQREAKGIATYGTTLQTHNGRNVYVDLAEELADAWQYAVQASIEHDDLKAENAKLSEELDHWRRMAAQHATERDSLRRTLGELTGIHPAGIVP